MGYRDRHPYLQDIKSLNSKSVSRFDLINRLEGHLSLKPPDSNYFPEYDLIILLGKHLSHYHCRIGNSGYYERHMININKTSQ